MPLKGNFSIRRFCSSIEKHDRSSPLWRLTHGPPLSGLMPTPAGSPCPMCTLPNAHSSPPRWPCDTWFPRLVAGFLLHPTTRNPKLNHPWASGRLRASLAIWSKTKSLPVRVANPDKPHMCVRTTNEYSWKAGRVWKNARTKKGNHQISFMMSRLDRVLGIGVLKSWTLNGVIPEVPKYKKRAPLNPLDSPKEDAVGMLVGVSGNAHLCDNHCLPSNWINGILKFYAMRWHDVFEIPPPNLCHPAARHIQIHRSVKFQHLSLHPWKKKKTRFQSI